MKRLVLFPLAALLLAGCQDASEPVAVDAPETATPGSTGLACVDPPSGLVSWWPGDGDAADIVGGNGGILVGDASFATGIVAQAFSFDGNGDAVRFDDVLDDVFAGPDKKFTIEFWTKINALPPSGDAASLISKLGASNLAPPENQRQFFLVVRPDGALDFGVHFTLAFSGARVVRAGTPLSTGTDHHIAVVYDGSIDTNDGLDRFTMYIDGALQSTSLIVSAGALGDVPDGAANLSIGAAVGANLGAVFFLNGLMDEVEIYDRTLSQAEIQAIFNAGDAGKCKALEFAEFDVERARLETDRGPGEDRFEVRGSFILGADNNGIDPITEEVTVKFDGFEQTIPPGSFFRDDDDEGFQFDGSPPGIKQIDIRDDGEFRVRGRDVDLGGIGPNSLVPFSLTIGNDFGDTEIQFDDGRFRQ